MDGSALEMFLDGERIVPGLYRPGCVLCGEMAETREVRGRPVCERCATEASAVYYRDLWNFAVGEDYGFIEGRPSTRCAPAWIEPTCSSRPRC